jgi:hypothetical protein
VFRAVQTCSPATVLISVTVVSMVMLPAGLIDSIVDWVTTTSPACSGLV